MRFELIESLQFHKLRDDTYDRRGPIVTVTLKKIPNGPYAEHEGFMIVKNVIALLNSTYGHIPEDYFGEQDECWINRAWDRQFNGGLEEGFGAGAITVQHKYWTPHQISAFVRILRTLAGLHGWAVYEAEA